MDWSWVVIGGPIGILLLWLVFEAGGYYWRWKHVQEFGHPAPDKTVAAVAIEPQPVRWWISLFKGKAMGQVVEGATDALMVVAKNKSGRVLPPAGATIALSQATDSVSTVDPVTGFFTFTAGSTDGDDNLVATVSGVASQPFKETVVADNTVATVEIQPQPPAPAPAP